MNGLFPPVVEQTVPQPAAPHNPSAHYQPPPLLTPGAIPIPKVVPSAPLASEAPWSLPEPANTTRHPPLGVYHVVLLSIGAACLAILAISPCLVWVTIMGGGLLGIEGDGKFLLFVTLGLGVGLGVELQVFQASILSVFAIGVEREFGRLIHADVFCRSFA